jgi:hypothetical protein
MPPSPPSRWRKIPLAVEIEPQGELIIGTVHTVSTPCSYSKVLEGGGGHNSRRLGGGGYPPLPAFCQGGGRLAAVKCCTWYTRHFFLSVGVLCVMIEVALAAVRGHAQCGQSFVALWHCGIVAAKAMGRPWDHRAVVSCEREAIVHSAHRHHTTLKTKSHTIDHSKRPTVNTPQTLAR